MEPIIEIKGIGKKYNIAHQKGGYIALRDILANVFRNPFKFAKSKAKKMIGLSTQEDFWALKDVNVEIKRGEVIGIIGNNGSGKSTLLKILTGITPRSQGEIIMRGRVASLLEVGTGFHPELTGRENVFLNGAILGMPQKEIARKFDDIVAFAGVEKFLDTPVKRYSSGMYVRLAFSVAAHMEPDILLVDEVLAVGDAEFQKKCLGKMKEVTEQDDRTILFVSHNMAAIQSLCKRTILLEKGAVAKFGETEEVINYYLQNASSPSAVEPPQTIPEFKIHGIVSKNKAGRPWTVEYGEDINLEIALESFVDIQTFQLGIGVSVPNNVRVATVHNDERFLQKGHHTIRIEITNPFIPGSYGLALNVINLFYLPNFATLNVVPNKRSEKECRPYNHGIVSIPGRFVFEQ